MFKKASRKKNKVKQNWSEYTAATNTDYIHGNTYESKTTSGQKGLCIQLKTTGPHYWSAQYSRGCRDGHALHQVSGDKKQEIPQTTDVNTENFIKYLFK